MPTETAIPQNMQALAHANHIRFTRVSVKRSIGAGQSTVADVLREIPSELEGMSIGELLRAQTRWGHHRTRRFLRPLAIPEIRKLRHLTARQRAVLVSSLPPHKGETR